MKIFVSHIREEKTAAIVLKAELEKALPGVTVWVSSIDLQLGEAWLQALEKELKGAKAVLVLCSLQSAGKPWINFESGFGYSKRMPVIPVCHRTLRKQQLPYPLRIFQACDVADPDDCANLVGRLAKEVGVEMGKNFTPETMSKAFAPRVERSHDIGIMLAQRQAEWDAASPFQLPAHLPEVCRNRWKFRPIASEDKVAAAEMVSLSGMIVGSPWDATMSAECIDELVDWVHAGGRMLLLGFELGDRHHSANLGDLARRFGIHPMIDIVGPPDHGSAKPYGVWTDFRPDTDAFHPLVKGLRQIYLRNVQTVMVEPGGQEWLRVGKNAIYRPAADRVEYRKGRLTQPAGTQFEVNADRGWVAVGVDAPKGLAHPGAVRFLGSWDLLREPADKPENDTPQLVKRLLDWLSGDEAPPAPM
jgi:hypothetical protein